MKVEKARITDAPQLHKLINHFADKGEMLPRPISEIYEKLRDFFVIRDGDEAVACVALHVCWSDLVEIKALAVAERQQNKGLGTTLVKACIEETKELGIPTIFCLTYKPAFFKQFGFKYIDRMGLPRKIWGECIRCPKFPNCDETAMILHLDLKDEPRETAGK